MRENLYLKWMASNTPTQWCNDSALPEDYINAVKYGAVGCTTNPPLTFQTITENVNIFGNKVDEIKKKIPDPKKRVIDYLTIVVKYISDYFMDMHKETGGKYGYVRTQVEPELYNNAEAMFEMGKQLAKINRNVKVKIPGTKAGIQVLEELAAMGIPTNPTVCVSSSQMISAAEAYERGCERAIKNGIEPASSTSAIVMGRLQDYLKKLNEERGNPVNLDDLADACLSVVKKTYSVFQENKYKQKIMPAAFRAATQVTELVGGDFCMTIHPKIQDMIIKAEKNGLIKREIRIDAPIDMNLVDRVSKHLPEFRKAYEPDGLSMDEFDDFGATQMTLDGFNETGWQKLVKL